MTRFKGLLVRFLCLMWVTFVPLCLKSQSVKVSTSFDKESKIFRWELENMTDSVVRIHNGENWEGNYNIHYHLLDANGTGNIRYSGYYPFLSSQYNEPPVRAFFIEARGKQSGEIKVDYSRLTFPTLSGIEFEIRCVCSSSKEVIRATYNYSLINKMGGMYFSDSSIQIFVY